MKKENNVVYSKDFTFEIKGTDGFYALPDSNVLKVSRLIKKSFVRIVCKPLTKHRNPKLEKAKCLTTGPIHSLKHSVNGYWQARTESGTVYRLIYKKNVIYSQDYEFITKNESGKFYQLSETDIGKIMIMAHLYDVYIICNPLTEEDRYEDEMIKFSPVYKARRNKDGFWDVTTRSGTVYRLLD